MIEKGLIITGSDAELLSCALSEVKTKSYEESEASLDDTEALSALVSGFRTAEIEEQEEERSHSYFSPLRKRLARHGYRKAMKREKSQSLALSPVRLFHSAYARYCHRS